MMQWQSAINLEASIIILNTQIVYRKAVPIAIQHLELDNEKPCQPRAHRLREPVFAVEVDQDDEHAKGRGNLSLTK